MWRLESARCFKFTRFFSSGELEIDCSTFIKEVKNNIPATREKQRIEAILFQFLFPCFASHFSFDENRNFLRTSSHDLIGKTTKGK